MFRDHADDCTAGLESTIGKCTHQADIAAAVHKCDALRASRRPNASAASMYDGTLAGLDPQ